MHCEKILIKYSAMIKVWFSRTFFQRLLVVDQPNIYPVANILHRHAKAAVVHEFEEIFLKLVLRLGTKVRIQLNVWFQPCFFVKGDSVVNLCYFQTEIQILFQIFVMENIFLLFIEVGNKFIDFIDFNPLWSEWILIVQIMKLL